MGPDSERIITTAASCDFGTEFAGTVEMLDAMKMGLRAMEADPSLAGADHWEVGWDEAKNRAEAEIEAGDLAVVRYLMDHENPRGTVLQTTKTAADTLERYGIAVRVSEEEAVAYGRRQRQISGGWMDDPKWKSFTGNFRRLLVAGAVRRAA